MIASTSQPQHYNPPIVSFVVHHAGAAEHFSAFAQQLIASGYELNVWATGIGEKKLTEKGIEVKHSFKVEGLNPEERGYLANEISMNCRNTFVITDVGHPFDAELQQTFASKQVMSMPYYENPENYVPGGYSQRFLNVVKNAMRIGFGNSNLAEEPLFSAPGELIKFEDQVKRNGIGYYPVGDAEKIALSRIENRAAVRAQFFKDHGLKDDQKIKILAYLGGNNDEYFNEAFPAFLSFVCAALHDEIDLSDLIIIFQPHPGAIELNKDGIQLDQWIKVHENHPYLPTFIRYLPEDALLMADALAYHQKSTTPIYALAGIPAFQTGKESYLDIPVKLGIFPSITTKEHFVSYIQALKEGSVRVPNEGDREAIYKAIGYKPDWFERLKTIIDEVGALLQARS